MSLSSESSFEVLDEREVAAGETVNGLPVVTDCEEFGGGVLVEEGADEFVAVKGEVLDFVDEDVFEV